MSKTSLQKMFEENEVGAELSSILKTFHDLPEVDHLLYAKIAAALYDSYRLGMKAVEKIVRETAAEDDGRTGRDL